MRSYVKTCDGRMGLGYVWFMYLDMRCSVRASARAHWAGIGIDVMGPGSVATWAPRYPRNFLPGPPVRTDYDVNANRLRLNVLPSRFSIVYMSEMEATIPHAEPDAFGWPVL